MYRLVVSCTQCGHACRGRVFSRKLAVIPGYVVRDEVDDDFQAGFMRASYQITELVHPLVRLICQIWIHVVIVCDGVR